MLFPPRAYIIGAPKAGTSSLAMLLAQHPAICLARRKEIHFFSANWEKGLGWYEAQFAPKSSAGLLLDASPSYSTAPLGPHTPAGYSFRPDRLKIPERMAALCADARLVYIVRNPIDRVYSDYWQAVRSGYETLPLARAIRENPEYVYGSLYFEQLQHYLRFFARESILLVSFRDLVRDLPAVARACLVFFGAEPIEFQFEDVRARNVGFKYNAIGHALRKFAGSEPSLSVISGLVRRQLPRPIYDALTRLVAKPLNPIDSQTRAIIEPYIAEDYRRWAAFTGMSLNNEQVPGTAQRPE